MENLLAEFINETRDLVQQASQDFLKLEENPEDKEIINNLFRAIHTIKGSSGIFDLAPLTELVHEAENILDQAREGKLLLTSDIVDVFLDILDQINMWMDELEAEEKLGPDAENYSNALKERLREVTKGLISEETEEPEEEVSEEKPLPEKRKKLEDEVIKSIIKIPLGQRINIIKSAKSWDDELYLIVYEPDENCFFRGDDPVLTVKKIPELVGYFCEPKEAWPGIEEFDPFICNLRFFAISGASKKDLEEHLMYVLEEVKIFPICVIDLVYPSGEPISNEQLTEFIKDVAEFLEKDDFLSITSASKVAKEIVSEESFQYSILSFLEVGLSKEPPLPKLYIKALINALKTFKFEIPDEEELEILEEQKPSEKPEPLKREFQVDPVVEDLLKKQIDILTIKCPDDVKIGQLKSIKTILCNVFKNAGFEDLKIETEKILDDLIKDFSYKKAEEAQIELRHKVDLLLRESGERKEEIKEKKEKRAEAPQPPKVKTPQIKAEVKVLKVDQEQIDSLMDLVSELVVAKNALPYLAKKAEEKFHSRELGRELKNQYATINRICEDLQNVVMQIRMIPVSHVFQRFPRLIRDLSKKLNKKVKLTIEGEDTRADKNVIEKMADPLVHIIRNSIDHGIESPEERVAKGKPEEGHIILSAFQLEDQVVIEVKDDGRGIDVEAVKRKAYEKGLVDEETLEKMSFQEALELIFLPGLSTAKEVSDLSGRGVGMDAVRAMVEEVGGKVNIKTEKDKGTTVSLSLPLSMAVTRVLMIEVGGELFGIPIENVSETVKIPKSEIHKVKDKSVIILRNRLIPLFRLKDILGINSKESKEKDSIKFYEEEEVAILIVALERYEFGLVVDEFHEGIDIVLKPLEGFMEKFTIYSGATLLGDGRVLLVLNPKELVKWL